MADSPTLEAFAEAVAAASPAPAGGAVAAVAASLAAALTGMVARLALAKAAGEAGPSLTAMVESSDRLRVRLLELATEDEVAYRAVVEARRARDPTALQAAWRRAAHVPAEVVRLCREVAQMAHRTARDGPPAVVGDAVMAALLAAAAAAGSQLNLRLNVQAAGGPPQLRILADNTGIVLREAQRAAADARLVAEERLTSGGAPTGRREAEADRP
jgi:formiminotetrahydrofolate cyclodeaminase